MEQPASPQPPLNRDSIKRTIHDRKLGGVCGGIAEATGVSVVWVRTGVAILALTGFGGPAYILAWLFFKAEDGSEVLKTPSTSDFFGLFCVGLVSMVGFATASGFNDFLLGAIVGSLPVVMILGGGILFFMSRRRPRPPFEGGVGPFYSQPAAAHSQQATTLDPSAAPENPTAADEPFETAQLTNESNVSSTWAYRSSNLPGNATWASQTNYSYPPRPHRPLPVFGPLWIMLVGVVGLAGFAFVAQGYLLAWAPIVAILIVLAAGCGVLATRKARSPLLLLATVGAIGLAAVPVLAKVPLATSGRGDDYVYRTQEELPDRLALLGLTDTRVNLLNLKLDSDDSFEIDVTAGKVKLLLPLNVRTRIETLGPKAEIATWEASRGGNGLVSSVSAVETLNRSRTLSDSDSVRAAQWPADLGLWTNRHPEVLHSPATVGPDESPVLNIKVKVFSRLEVYIPRYVPATVLKAAQACLAADSSQVFCGQLPSGLQSPMCLPLLPASGVPVGMDIGSSPLDCSAWEIVKQGSSQNLACQDTDGSAEIPYFPCSLVGLSPVVPPPNPKTLGTPENPIYEAPPEVVAKRPGGAFAGGRNFDPEQVGSDGEIPAQEEIEGSNSTAPEPTVPPQSTEPPESIDPLTTTTVGGGK